jgi:predicted Zn-dependent peptidase
MPPLRRALPLSRRRLLALGALAAGAVAVPWPRRAAIAAAEPMRAVLANGLVVIVDPRADGDQVALQLTARVGARDDTLAGITALTSRLIFAGTARRPSATALQSALAEVGGTLERKTEIEYSTFSTLLPWREAETGFDVLADLVAAPLFDPAALASQQALALQEIAARLAQPSDALDELYRETLFSGTPLGRPLEGTPESVLAIGLPDVVTAFNRNWRAANLVLTVVGRITLEAALAQAAQYFGGLPTGTLNQRGGLLIRTVPAPERVSMLLGEEQVQYRLGVLAPGLRDPDRYALAVLNGVIGGGAGGRMFREVRTLRGLAYGAYSSYDEYTDAGTWYAWGTTDPGTLEPAMAVVRAEIQRARGEPIGVGEITDAIGKLAGETILAAEPELSRANDLAKVEVLGDVPSEEFVRRIQAVTPADVQRVAQAYLDLDHSLFATVGPA